MCDGNDADTAAQCTAKFEHARPSWLFLAVEIPTSSPKNFKFLGDATRSHPRERRLCGFWPTARRSLHATNTATSPCSLHETGTRRGRRCPHHDAVGGVPIAWVVRTRVRDSRRLRAIPGSKADAGRTRFHPPAPLSGSPHLRPATARPRVVARDARHRKHALHAHRAVIARTHRAARGHRRRCRDQCAWDVLAKPETRKSPVLAFSRRATKTVTQLHIANAVFGKKTRYLVCGFQVVSIEQATRKRVD